ncbi:MAG: M48 family metalloprotease [Pseudomonadota bacterium]|nr:M48 family metalloprotease [Pseudomonadota bacterium]
MDRRYFLKATSSLTAITFLSGCATNPVTGDQDLVFMSEDEEAEIGRASHKQLMQSYKQYNNPDLSSYITIIGEKLANISHRKELIYHFTLLDSPQVNAFALPGGYIYMTRGMLAYLGSEAELAGVLGHELGHVTARHGARAHAKHQISGVVSTLLGIFVGDRRVSDLTNLFSLALLRGYGRENELEADRIGAEYMQHIGYDPNSLLQVIGVLKNQEEFDKKLAKEENREPYAYHGIFSTHPDNDKRLQGIIKAVKDNKSDKDLGERKLEFLKMISGIPVGPGEGEGSVRGSSFYHNDLDFTVEFPGDWKIENLPDRIVATTKDRNTFIQVNMRDLNRKIPPKETLERFYANGDKLDDGIDISTQDYKGYAAIVKLDTPFGQSHPCWVCILYRTEKDAFVLVATTEKEKDIVKYKKDFIKTFKSLRKLKEDERALGEPRRIKIHTAKKNDTFKKYAESSPYATHAEDRLRVLNNFYPSGEPTEGQLIKLVF